MSSPLRCLLILLAIFVSALARGQSIQLSVREKPLAAVMRDIEAQTDFTFLYTREQLTGTRPVTLSVAGQPLAKVLDQIFADQPLAYTMEGKQIILRTRPVKPVAADRPLGGIVTDAEGLPVAGITIAIRAVSLQTVTDGSGRFSFSHVPVNSFLDVSGAEVEPLRIPTGSLATLPISIVRKTGVLDEAYVIAYGTATRRTAMGTVTSVKQTAIERQVVANPLGALAGRVPGLQVTQSSGSPGSPFQIRLRGQNSLANGNDPLIMVDGIPFPLKSLNNLVGGGFNANPLSALNPADIASIEVLKDADATAIYGSRGANGVILITTRGASTGPTRVRVRHHSGAGRAVRNLKMMNRSEYLTMRREAFDNDGLVPTATTAPDLLLWDTTRYTNWQETLLGETSFLHDTKVEVSGGNAQTRFMAGLSHRQEGTMLPVSRFGERKLSGNLHLSHASADQRLRLQFSASYSSSRIRQPQGDISAYLNLPPNAPALFLPDGKLNWEGGTWTNPWSILLRDYESLQESSMYNVSVDLRVVAGLSARLTAGYSQLKVNERNRTPLASFDPTRTNTARAGFGYSSLNTLNVEPQVHYRQSVGGWNIQALAGFTIQGSDEEGISHTSTGYASDDLLGSLRSATTVTVGSERAIEYRYTGLFGRVQADLHQRYLFSFTGRRDGSSRYGPENRFANFGSAGLGWIFSRERFMSRVKFVSFAKLKVTAGVSGNDQIGDYRFLDVYNPISNPYQQIVTFQPVQLFSPDFSWERVRKWEVSLDMGFFKDRLLVTTNFYFNRTDNQLVQYPLPPSTGFTGVLRNLPARIDNTGLEVSIQGAVVQRRDFQYTQSFNMTVPRNKLVSFDNFEQSSYVNTHVIGEPLFIRKLYQLNGVDAGTGNYVFEDFNHDGRISNPLDQQAVVFTGQLFFGGWEHQLMLRRFTLQFMLQYARYPNAESYVMLFGRPGQLGNQPRELLDRWSGPGDATAKFQRYSYNNSANATAYSNLRLSTGVFSDASFIRLRNVYLSYNLLSERWRKAGLSEALVFMQAQNLLTFTKYNGMDPETRTSMPPLRQVSVGIQLTF